MNPQYHYCKYCGAKLKQDPIGQYCPTKNCQWQHGLPKPDDTQMRTAVPIPKFPRDHKGRAVPKECPHCNGTLQWEGEGFWRCDGLIDPKRADQELQPCTFSHEDGQPYTK